jgi:hypothetical protein
MLSELKTQLFSAIKNARGFRTKRRLVVFESDDWGSIRMPSTAVYKSLTDKGIDLKSPGGDLFNRFDTLADIDDLSALFEVLNSVKDAKGSPAVFTAVSVAANPDFEKIRANNFDSYYFESFTDTLKKYQNHSRTFEMWKEGISHGLFIPQSHSREHLNSALWLRNLQTGDKETLIAFDHGMWSFDRKDNKPSYQIAYSLNKEDDLSEHKNRIISGLNLFEKTFNYRSSLFVPPNGLMHKTLEEVTNEFGIKYLYSSFSQLYPEMNGTYKRQFNYLGKCNEFHQYYIVRNCNFEPNMPNVDWVGVALKQIDTAFKWGKPAILGPHRKNFIGQHDETNRRDSLASLKSLLQQIVVKWPDVEFITSTELGKMMDDE